MHTKDKILEGARNYLVVHGQAGFTVRAVASEAGVNPGLVHHYFGSKDNLIMSLLEKESAEILDKARQLKEDMGLNVMRKALVTEFFANLVVGRLFVEAIILAEKSEGIRSRLREIITHRRNYFTDLLGIHDPMDKIMLQASLFGLQLLKKIDPAIVLEETVGRCFSTFVTGYLQPEEDELG